MMAATVLATQLKTERWKQSYVPLIVVAVRYSTRLHADKCENRTRGKRVESEMECNRWTADRIRPWIFCADALPLLLLPLPFLRGRLAFPPRPGS